MKLRAVALFAVAVALCAQAPVPQKAASNMRPNGWLVRPLGREVALEGTPLTSVLSPDGQFLLVLTAGPKPAIHVFSAKTEKQLSGYALPNGWLGLAFSPNGRLLYVGGGSTGAVYELNFSPEGELRPAREMPTVDRDAKDADANTGVLIGDVAVTPDGRMLLAADVLHNQVLMINLSSGRVVDRYAAGRRPYRISMHPNGKTFFVTAWADGTLTQYETLTGRRVNGVPVGAHATDIAWRDKKTVLEEGADPQASPWIARMFVPAANTNNIYSVALSEGGDVRVVESIALGLFVDSPVGVTPSAAALSPDQTRVYVALSDANALAVVYVAGVKARLLGFIPTGEYPTSVSTLQDGRIVVLNSSGADGASVQFINPPADLALNVPTGIVLANSPLKATDDRRRPIAMNPVPFTPGEPTPIEHVVYILKEGVPYTDAGQQAAPNQFKLAREFTPLTNFAATGSNPVDGFYWSTASIVPDYVRKFEAAVHDGKPQLDALDIAAQPPAGYLWNQTAASLFGIVPTARGARGAIIAGPLSNPDFPAPDPKISDTTRAQAFLKQLAQFEQQQNLPRLIMLRLAGDRPGTPARGERTTQAALADNDYALGLVVEGLTHSKFWPKMAIVVAGTNAPDHQASAFVVSPYATRGKPATAPFNTLSLLATIEHILALAPMTQFDAGAAALDDAFQPTPDLRPFDAERPRVPTDALVQ